MVHQSDTYFEHCHGADLDPRLRVEQKHACWSAWLDHYAEGQAPDRVRYAEERCAALAAGEQLPPLPGTSAAVSYTSSSLTMPDGAMSQELDAASDAAPDSTAEPSDDPPVLQETPPATVETAGGEEPETSEGPDPDVVQPRRYPQVRYTPPSPPRMNESPCQSVCDPGWEQCIVPCRQRGEACTVACEVEYRSCMNGCY